MNAPVSESVIRPPVSLKKLDDFYDVFQFTGPGTLAGRYMRQFWLPVGASDDLKPGTAKPITVMSEKFTLFRGETGIPHVLPFHCPHRGTQLSVGYIEGDSIRCLYHGWAFDGSGQCVDQPAEDPEMAAKVCLKSYPVQEYLGLIWSYIGEGEPPAFPPIPGFENEGPGHVHSFVEQFTHNYFQAWENDFDIYHAAFTHRTGGLHTAVNFKLMMEGETYEEKDFGIERHIPTPMGDFVSSLLMPTTVRLLVPLFNEETRGVSGTGAPVLLHTYLIHVPLDDHNDLVYAIRYVPLTGAAFDAFMENYNRVEALRKTFPTIQEVAAEIRAGKKALKDAINHPAFILIEDLCAQGGQGVIADRRAERLGRSDRGIMMLRRIWQRELTALAEGRPTKDWARPAQLPTGDFMRPR